jgi:hypothetical protein
LTDLVIYKLGGKTGQYDPEPNRNLPRNGLRRRAGGMTGLTIPIDRHTV